MSEWDVIVVGGGIAGLTTAYKLAGAGGGPSCCVVEASSRFGGKIVTDRVDGFVVEGGPDSILTLKPWAHELIRELGLGDRLIDTEDGDRTTSMLFDGRLVPMPEGLQLVPRRLGPWLRSPLLTWRGKLRCAAERWIPRRSDAGAPGDLAGDESVADFVRRRLGREVLERLAEPLLGHIHVADVERLSLRSTYPRLAEIEGRFGSLWRGLRAARPAAAGGGPLFQSLRGGLGELIDALVDRLPPESRWTGRRVAALGRDDRHDHGRWAVTLEDGTRLTSTAVVLATPAWASAELVSGLDPLLARRLAAIRYAGVVTVSLGFRRADLAGAEPRGYGFFVPRREGRPILAGSWTSGKFAHRAGPDDVLVRLFVGGALREELLDLDDEAVLATVRSELADLFGWRAAPALVRLYRWPRGYPQYEVGHGERLRAIEEALPPGLFVTGSGYRGVGLPDCVQHAGGVAEAVTEYLGREAPVAALP